MTRSILPTVSSYPTNLARAIVVYEGDNDLARGYSSEQITATFLRFVDRVHRQLPESRIYYFLSIKPSPKRWELWPKMQETNGLIAKICQRHPQLTYVDIATPMLDAKGLVRTDIFTNDNLHLNKEGYVIWRDVLKPILMERGGNFWTEGRLSISEVKSLEIESLTKTHWNPRQR